MGKDRQEKNSKLQAESNQIATSPFTMTERQALNKTEDSKSENHNTKAQTTYGFGLLSFIAHYSLMY